MSIRLHFALALSAALAAAPGGAYAKTVRTLVAIGSSDGDPEDPPLHYAATDATRFQTLFVEIGHVSADRAYLLVDQPVSVIREKLAEVAGRLAEVRASGDDGLLIIYASGHAKAGELHVQGAHLPLAELRQYLDRVPARLKLLIVDACESGQVARWKGGVPVPEFEVDLSHPPLSGEVVISSSGPHEPSQEWDALGGSLFTHHLLTGLRGDADLEHDGRVTLAEAYAYAYRRTVVDAQGPSQHPSLDVDLSGAGELVLTEPSSARGALVFPGPSEGRFVVASQPRTDVVAEIDKKAGAPIRIAVPPGHYLIRKNEDRFVAMSSIELPYGGEAVIDERKMSQWPFTEARMKGGYVDLQPDALMVGGSVENEQIDGAGNRYSAEITYRHVWGEWWVASRLGFAPVLFHAVSVSSGAATHELDTTLSAAVGRRWMSVPFSIYAGWQAGPTLLRQHTDPSAGQSPPDNWVLGVSTGPTVAVEIPLSARWFGVLEGDGSIRYLPQQTSSQQTSSWSVGALGRVGVGGRF